MKKDAPGSTANPGTLFIVSTSHMDWDWLYTSEYYYKNSTSGSTKFNNSVRNILTQAFSLIETTPNSTYTVGYQYNLAEVVWIKRYVDDTTTNPLPDLSVLQGRFYFLGGGITSPDNLVCNGEAFIRNYLVGRAYVNSIGLGNLMTDVCWIPDDFGHDPQLPIVLNAMGMTGVSFWRVPGNEPTPPATYSPVSAHDRPAMSAVLMKDPTFRWQASDGSRTLTTQMWDNYGVIWNQADANAASGPDTVATLNSFVESTVPAGSLYMAPCGGDFSIPSSILLDTVTAYNDQTGYPPAKMATFQEFVDEVNAWVKSVENSGGPDPLITRPLDPSNFWTGHFSSRVQLKINQQMAVNNLMAAETLSTLLQLQTRNASPMLGSINTTIDEAWTALVPSTHHDYVNGTSADDVYTQEQLPLLDAALGKSLQAVNMARHLLGQSVQGAPQNGEIPYVVFNPSGFVRTLGNLVEIEDASLSGVKSFRLPGQQTRMPVQVLTNGHIVFPYDGLDSTGYGCVYFSTANATGQVVGAVTAEPVTGTSDYGFANSLVSFQVSGSNAWALSSIRDIKNGNAQLLSEGGFGNLISMYTEYFAQNGYQGNNYQMAQEFCQSPLDPSAFYPNTGAAYTCDGGSITENGMYLCRFSGTLTNPQVADTTVEYTLLYNEPLIRVKVNGQAVTKNNASADSNTVVSSWNINGASAEASGAMNYGTGNHWNGPDFVPYWHGPTFRSTHDYLTLVNPDDTEGNPLAALYHVGMRAWAMNEGTLQGILFRNAPGNNRGAKYLTDSDMHTQHFAFRIPGVGNPQSCQPLQESMAFQQALLSTPSQPINSVMGETGLLASLYDSDAIIRVARPQSAESFVLRIYQPTNSTGRTWDLNIPYLNDANPEVSLVTALEEDFETPPAPAPVFTKGVVTIRQMPTLTTLRVSAAN